MLVRRYRFTSFPRIAGGALPARLGMLAVLLLLAFLAVNPGDALAQQVVLTNTRGLDFGRFVAGSGGTIVVTPAGLRSRTGAVVLLNSPSVGQASFTASRSGGNKTIVTITLPANGSVRISSGVSNSMAVNTFVRTPSTATLSIQTAQTIAVGATLTVAPNQAPGNYSGTFPLTVNYQ
jgi:hypothetical protein